MMCLAEFIFQHTKKRYTISCCDSIRERLCHMLNPRSSMHMHIGMPTRTKQSVLSGVLLAAPTQKSVETRQANLHLRALIDIIAKLSQNRNLAAIWPAHTTE